MTNPDPYGQYPAQPGGAFPPPPAQFPPNPGTYLPPPQQQPYPPQGYPYPAAHQKNSMALTSLVLGIAGMLCCGALLGIPAIITGVIARRQIAESTGTQSGDGQALWGIILGAVASVLTVFAFFIWVISMASTQTYPGYR